MFEILPNIRFTSIVWYFLTSSLLLSLAKSYHQTLDLGTDAALCRFREVYCRTNIIAVLLYFTAAVTFCAEPPTQMATLRWNGDGEFMSWRWEKLGEAFEDGAARFAAESRIVSPRWAELDVLGAEVALKCSTNMPSRFLQVSFLRDGKAVSGPIRFEAVAVADKREAQSLAVSRANHANGIALSVSDGTVGDWGVYEVRLTTAPTTYVPPPSEPTEPPNEPAEQPKKQTGFMIIIK